MRRNPSNANGLGVAKGSHGNTIAKGMNSFTRTTGLSSAVDATSLLPEWTLSIDIVRDFFGLRFYHLTFLLVRSDGGIDCMRLVEDHAHSQSVSLDDSRLYTVPKMEDHIEESNNWTSLLL